MIEYTLVMAETEVDVTAAQIENWLFGSLLAGSMFIVSVLQSFLR